MQRRDRYIAQSLGQLTKSVKDSRVLLVGAGGIGCELLKNLVCCGFGTGLPQPQGQNGDGDGDGDGAAAKTAEIVVIDLDTIDLSNLNRQFLFRKQHLKKPKAIVAKETASQFNPSVNIDAQHASIFDSQYNVDFFEGFDVVFNALDNLKARQHVNRMCLAADVPLIESGTTGFNGQVQPIKKGITECYDCNQKPVQKSFPICTIRSTPSQPIHCIVWAKSYLLPELFGMSEEESSEVAVTEGDNAQEVAKLKEEAEALKKVRNLLGKDEFAQEIFNKVFHDDIERLRSMSEMWQSRTPPDSLRFESVCIDSNPAKQGETLAAQDQAVWSLQDNLKVFCHAVEALTKRVQNGEKVIEFDKDDKDTLDFVAAAANLRSHVFHIPLNSEWDIKQMAGNIIPAIATSNALTASLCVMQAFKIMRSQTPKINAYAQPTTNNAVPTNSETTNGKPDPLLGGAKMVFLNSKSTERVIANENLSAPKPDCPVCSPFYAKLQLKQGTTPTLQSLVDLLKQRLNYEDFSITADAGMIYDPDLEDNLEKPMKDFGIDGTNTGFVTVQDDSSEPKVDLVLSVISKAIPEDDSDMILLPDTIELPPKPGKKMEVNGISIGGADAAVEVGAGPSSAPKRKRSASVEEGSAPKKAKGEAKGEAAGQAVIVDEDDGAIILD
ncbi:Ubiquitin-activating enzyme E1-like [Lecanosticta acicola]|uniref:Ubiquitin-activating enzyme E1-like n=1 Tax=Lecanosticta acicola TaxID=111012 RepID=A0AAI9E8H7_9PEZI|nr:Ubiquitin-activating enzyme E1-like [Lecanosticta acicola]